MINSSLQAFADQALKAGRISFGDVKRLQRDILPDGISSRAEAELLLTLDQTISRADRAFADWLVAMMVDFVVWGLPPPAPWMRRLQRGSRPSWSARGRRRQCVSSPGSLRLRRTIAAPPCPLLI